MHSFSAEVGSRGYHVYRKTSWRNIHLHQQVVMLKEVNNISIDINPYCCRITIKRVERIGPLTVGHVPRELSRFILYFIQEGGLFTARVASTTSRISPIPEGGLEVPILMHFTHENKAISLKMEILVRKQVEENICRRELFWKLSRGKPYVCRRRRRKRRKIASWERF